ncbi:Os04g0137400 [Oryza sativa Japonica Group]|uniref:OSJNBa0095E20.10 protein n=1 Tax=Oryza sativa subsp. japonica TaxID=39947 RepID=Q7XRM6_ORYSJ|nr:Os04g0137400 [Oryza sativa Japonica Group]CAE02422.2 OSJNBa0095E20.10 [Oryza sativa Japonica Group]|eukprot:NP_001173746.1 Os04g0137400 [Oryza sativa Japonica Group]
MEGHPLLHHLQQPTLAYTWDPQLAPFDHVAGAGDQVAFSTALELRQALLRALAELDAARAAHQAELRRMESEAGRLDALVAQPPAPPTPTPQVSSLPAAHVVAVPAVADELAALDAADEAELEMALARRLPEKGRLVEAVVSAGPLLQTLLLAGPLPRWRHPPPPAPADIPPFNPTKAADADNNSFSSASATSSSPESNCSGGGGHAPLVSPALPYHMIPFCM